MSDIAFILRNKFLLQKVKAENWDCARILRGKVTTALDYSKAVNQRNGFFAKFWRHTCQISSLLLWRWIFLSFGHRHHHIKKVTKFWNLPKIWINWSNRQERYVFIFQNNPIYFDRFPGCESGTGTFWPTGWSDSPPMTVSTFSTKRAPSTGFYRFITIPPPPTHKSRTFLANFQGR